MLTAGAVAHAGLLLLWIPRFGLNGAALAVGTGFLVPLVAGTPLIHRRVPDLPPLRSVVSGLRGTFLATIGAGVAAALAARTSYPSSGVLPLLVTLAAGTAVYVSLLFLFRGLRREDLRRFSRLFGSAFDAAHRD